MSSSSSSFSSGSSSSSSSGSSASSSSTSSSSSRLHEASLVEPSFHNPALDELRALPVDEHLITYIVDCVTEVVQHAMLVTHAHAHSSSPTTTTPPPPPPHITPTRRLALTSFISRVLASSHAPTPLLLASLVYVHRARPHLRVAVDEWALERVFLGALILASKYTNDVGLKNRHWAVCTGVFGRRDVSRVEREFLEVLDFELGISELDLLRHYAGLTLQARGRTEVGSGREEGEAEMWDSESNSSGSSSDDDDSEGPLTPACERTAAASTSPDYFAVPAVTVASPSKPVSFYASSSYFTAKGNAHPHPHPQPTALPLHHPRPLPLPHMVIPHPPRSMSF